MKHLGDITKINGSTVKPVNVIIGGSPCQDLSVAGKRAGLAGERSGLFMEQIRVIKEMRCADAERGRTGSDIRPRWMVWENVPGAFSSNKGEDFGAVLHETIKVVCPQAPPVPVPKYGWPPIGCLTDLGGKWSLAWRVFDAQFWGVPQRRKRIALVCDFGGLTAPEILFERKGVPGYSPPSGAPWQTFTRSVAESAGEKSSVIPINDKATRCNGGGQPGTMTEPETALELEQTGTPAQPSPPEIGTPSFYPVENHPQDCRVKLSDDGIVQTLSGKMGTGGGNVPLILKCQPVCVCGQDVPEEEKVP